jgi:hypothetical protein
MLFVGTYTIFLKGYDADYWINTKLPMNYRFGKNICAELVKTGGAAGEWLITDEFFTDLDEMDIFVLSKDQTFRICATFLDPSKFSILVIHLIELLFWSLFIIIKCFLLKTGDILIFWIFRFFHEMTILQELSQKKWDISG